MRLRLIGLMIIAVWSGAAPSRAGVEVDGWYGYPSEAYEASSEIDVAIAGAAAASGFATSFGVEAAVDSYHFATTTTGVRPSSDASGGGYSCHFVTHRPNGIYDKKTRYFNGYVQADVFCNFDAPYIGYTVNFEGYDPADPGGFVLTSNTLECRDSDACIGLKAYRNVTSCNGPVEHYGRPHGVFKTPDGKTHPMVGTGREGPINKGSVVGQYC